ncbi:MAG TPA: UbiA family prenyltransferase [Saprospiraceae bacterium]|nr:UbiA family prenyltransferase [Saprospiraceae bacterium]
MVWIAVCAIAMLEQTRILLGLPVSICWLELFVFCGTIFGYHFNHPVSSLRILAWSMAIPAALGVWQLDLPYWLLATPAFGWLAYYGFEQSGKTGLRNRMWAKPITVALTWGWVTVVLPAYAGVHSPFGFMFLERSFFIFALALAYDQSDVAYDQTQGFGTLAMSLGRNRTLALIYGCMLASGIAAFGQHYASRHLLGIWIALIIGALWLRTILHKPQWYPWHKPMIDGVMVMECLSVGVFECLSA